MRKALTIVSSSFIFFINLSHPCTALEANISSPDITEAADLQFGTNLPDETRVKLCISDGSETIRCEGNTSAFKGIIKDPATNGCLRELQAGRYLLEIITAYSQFQPEVVRAVIGERGEHLHGELALKKMLGTRVWMARPMVVQEDGRLSCRQDQ